jgi:hypothetical protein
MPSLKSSSKGGDTITLFASEHKQLAAVRSVLFWLARKVSNPDLIEQYEDAGNVITDVLAEYTPAPKQRAPKAEPATK